MALTITIGGVDQTSKIERNTFALTNALGQRDTLTLSVKSDDATYRPEMGATFEVEHSELGAQFGGTIRRTQTSLRGASILTAVQCASWEQIFDRRLVGEVTFTDQPAGDVFQSIFDDFLVAENLTATIVESGPNISISFAWCTVREAFDQICAVASSTDDTFMWDCTPAKVTRLYSQASFAAPIDVTEDRTDIFRNIIVTRTFDSYVNRVFVRLGKFITEERSNVYHPAGTESTLAFEIPIAKAPTITVDAVEATVGIRDVDTGKDFYWQDGSTDVTVSDPGSLTGTEVIILAQGYQSTVVDAGQNDDEVTARSIAEDNSGQYMTLIENNAPGTSADARAFGEAWLAKFSRLPYSVEYQTTYGGIRAGMYQQVTLTKFGPDFDGTFIVESSTLVNEGNQWFWRVTVVNGALANGWLSKLRKIVTGSSSSVGSGGGTGAPGPPGEPAAPAPAAPNVSFSSADVVYSLASHNPVFGFDGVIDLPTGDDDYENLKRIDLVAYGSDDRIVPICSLYAVDFSGSTAAFSGGEIPQSGSVSEDWDLEALAINDDNKATASPATESFTVGPAAVTSINTPREISGTLEADSNRVVYTTIGGIPVFANGQVPQNVTTWLSDDSGSNYKWINFETVDTVGAEITCQRAKPITSETWKFAMSAGAIGGDPSVIFAAASLPATAVVSSGFTVSALAVPASGQVSTLTVTSGAGGSFPYNRVAPDGQQYFSIPTISFTEPANDPNTFLWRLTATDLNAATSAISAEQPAMSWVVGPAGLTQSWGPLEGLYEDIGYRYTRSGDIAKVRLKLYACNRVDQTENSFSNAAAATLQVTSDITVASGGATPDGMIPATRFDPDTLGTGLTKDGTSKRLILNTTNITNAVLNGSFENEDAGWTGIGFSVISSGAETGTKRAKLDPTISGVQAYVDEEEPHTCKKDQQIYADARVASDSGVGSGGFSACLCSVVFLDSARAFLSSTSGTGVNDTGGNTTYVTVSVEATVPVGASYWYVQVYASSTAPPAGKAWYVDNITAVRQVPAGDGVEKDGRGGLKFRPGKGQKIDVDGTATLNVGNGVELSGTQLAAKLKALSGLTFDGSGAQQAQLGYTMRLDGSGNIVLSNLPAAFGRPPLPQAAYPQGSVIIDLFDNKLYRNVSGGAWIASAAPADLVAGAVASGVTIAAAQISAGSLNVGVLYGGTINVSQLLAGTMVVASGSSAGTVAITVTGGSYSMQIRPGALFLNSPTGLQALMHVDSGIGNLHLANSSSGLFFGVSLNGGDISNPPTITVAGSRVVSTRKTGWSLCSGGSTKGGWATSTVSLQTLAETVRALIDSLHASTAGHGLIG